jgi:hypothetical protein
VSGHLSDADAQERLLQQERRLTAIEQADLQDLLKHPWGRRLYYRLVFLLCGLESPSYAEAFQQMAFLEGRRDIGITLRDEAQAVCPELWTRMVAEQVAARAEDALARREAITSSQERDK